MEENKILVKRLKVGDKVVIKKDLKEEIDTYETFSGVEKEMADLAGREATIERADDVSFLSIEYGGDEIQCFSLDIDETDYWWNINMFESINGEENPYKDIITDEFNSKFVPMDLID